jgi:diadenosine tetraphosphate (Ap4A) HIT family hydrolase|uniref:Histidine triad (HIT) protein n=1 Tax=Caulobacter sp. (strain K31) TaxID=366602 RepID=B0T5P9_CAUSK
MTDPTNCKICGMLRATAPEDVVYDGPNWAVVAMQDVPGMLMAFTRVHDRGPGSLSEAAAAQLGPLINRLSATLTATGVFEKASVIYLGDNALHTHFMLLGRKPGDERIFDNAPLLARFAGKDRDGARAMAADLREALRELATSPLPA